MNILIFEVETIFRDLMVRYLMNDGIEFEGE